MCWYVCEVTAKKSFLAWRSYTRYYRMWLLISLASSAEHRGDDIWGVKRIFHQGSMYPRLMWLTHTNRGNGTGSTSLSWYAHEDEWSGIVVAQVDKTSRFTCLFVDCLVLKSFPDKRKIGYGVSGWHGVRACTRVQNHTSKPCFMEYLKTGWVENRRSLTYNETECCLEQLVPETWNARRPFGRLFRYLLCIVGAMGRNTD